MVTSNHDIAKIFNQVADILEIKTQNPFRVRAYRNAAHAIEDWPEHLPNQLRRSRIPPKIPGLGKDLTSKLLEIATTGHLSLLDSLKKETPEGLIALLNIGICARASRSTAG